MGRRHTEFSVDCVQRLRRCDCIIMSRETCRESRKQKVSRDIIKVTAVFFFFWSNRCRLSRRKSRKTTSGEYNFYPRRRAGPPPVRRPETPQSVALDLSQSSLITARARRLTCAVQCYWVTSRNVYPHQQHWLSYLDNFQLVYIYFYLDRVPFVFRLTYLDDFFKWTKYKKKKKHF